VERIVNPSDPLDIGLLRQSVRNKTLGTGVYSSSLIYIEKKTEACLYNYPREPNKFHIVKDQGSF
jgi:hypothetical protein